MQYKYMLRPWIQRDKCKVNGFQCQYKYMLIVLIVKINLKEENMKRCSPIQINAKHSKLMIFPIPLMALRLIDPGQEQIKGVVAAKTPTITLVMDSK